MGDDRVRLRPEIASMIPYRQGRSAAEDAFKLSSNENPFPPLPEVVEALTSAKVNRYPEASAVALRDRLGAKFGISPERVHVGAGSVSILAQLITAAAAPGEEVVYAWRSFEAYPGLVASAGASAVEVPLTTGYRHDTKAMAAAVNDRTRLILVCSPNNPTSTVVTFAEFEELMDAVPPTVLVALDEAYAEFVNDPSAVRGHGLLDRYPNLVVLRTFSKAYGLAGLRIGYAIGPEYVMDAARAVAIPLSVTEPAQRAALVSLDHEAELMERVGRLNLLRDRIWAGLVGQGWDTPEPHGNFVWLQIGPRVQEASEVLMNHGIVARALGDGLRVSVGEAESVDKLLTAAAEVVGMRPNA